MAAEEISLKLLVDKEKNQVVYAESDKDFVDVLFGFLTMPIGTIVRLLRNQSKIGGMSTLYESVKDLDVQLLQTVACKNMLLHPKSTSEEHCKNLKVNIDDTKPTQYYICSSRICRTQIHRLTSTVKNAPCRCGKLMSQNIVPTSKSINVVGDENGVFVKGSTRFMISDDLLVSPISTMTSLELLKKLGTSDANCLEERNVNAGSTEVLNLLERLLLSRTPLTDVFLRKLDTVDELAFDLDDIALDSKDMYQSKIGKKNRSDTNKIRVKLVQSKSTRKVLYAEAKEEFPDLLFSFLAFPLGSIAKCLGGCTSMGCLDSLYKSVEELSNNNYMKSDECKAMLLEPKLPPFFSSKNQPLKIEESEESCLSYNYIRYTCLYKRRSRIELSTVNPKYPHVVLDFGGSFMAGQSMFMVTDDLNVKPLSPFSGISRGPESNIPISDLEEQEVSIGKEEALSLLKASLISKTVLSDVFFSKKPVFCSKKPKKRMRSYKRLFAAARDDKTELFPLLQELLGQNPSTAKVSLKEKGAQTVKTGQAQQAAQPR